MENTKEELARLKSEYKSKHQIQRDIQSECSRLMDRIKELEAKTAEIQLTVTDHALVQYLSRIIKLDIEQYKNALIDGLDFEMHSKVGKCKLPLSGGGYAVVDKGTVITIY